MEKTIIKLAEIILKDETQINDIGLMHGKMGICIFFYRLSRHTKNAYFENVAERLLNEVYANVSKNTSKDFEYGLAGIGWGLNYLIQNGYVEGNPDDILKEIDDKIFYIIAHNPIPEISLLNGNLGFMAYLLCRLNSTEDENKIFNEQLIIDLINLTSSQVSASPQGLLAEPLIFDCSWNLFWFLLIYIKVYKYQIHKLKIEKTIEQLIYSIMSYLPPLHANRQLLVLLLEHIKFEMSIKDLDGYIVILKQSIRNEKIYNELRGMPFLNQYSFLGLIYFIELLCDFSPNNSELPELKKSYVIKLLSEQFDEEFFNLKKTPSSYGIAKGIAGLGLGLINYCN